MAWIARIVAALFGVAVLLLFVTRPWEMAPGARDAQPVLKPAFTEQAAPAGTDATARLAVSAPGVAEPTATQSKAGETSAGGAAATKPHLLAREQAEQDRFAKLETGHATAPGPRQTKIYFRVKIRDGATLEATPGGGSSPMSESEAAAAEAAAPESPPCVIHLEGVAVREVTSTCLDAGGLAWPCGARARAALVRVIRTRAVTCRLPPGGEAPDFAARCTVGGIDLSLWMVRQGWAEPKPGAEQALGDALKAAKEARLGVWHGGDE